MSATTISNLAENRLVIDVIEWKEWSRLGWLLLGAVVAGGFVDLLLYLGFCFYLSVQYGT